MENLVIQDAFLSLSVLTNVAVAIVNLSCVYSFFYELGAASIAAVMQVIRALLPDASGGGVGKQFLRRTTWDTEREFTSALASSYDPLIRLIVYLQDTEYSFASQCGLTDENHNPEVVATVRTSWELNGQAAYFRIQLLQASVVRCPGAES